MWDSSAGDHECKHLMSFIHSFIQIFHSIFSWIEEVARWTYLHQIMPHCDLYNLVYFMWNLNCSEKLWAAVLCWLNVYIYVIEAVFADRVMRPERWNPRRRVYRWIIPMRYHCLLLLRAPYQRAEFKRKGVHCGCNIFHGLMCTQIFQALFSYFRLCSLITLVDSRWTVNNRSTLIYETQKFHF